MDFYTVLDQVLALLRQHGRVSYRALKRQFDLNDACLEDLKGEIINVHHYAVDQDGTMLVWTGAAPSTLTTTPPPLGEPLLTSHTALEGERRQVTVLFADISGFTALAETLDPEVVRNVMNACFACLVPVVEKYAGTVDKFMGDAIMAVFGAPVAQENDAARAVYTALEMLEALTAFNADQGTALGLHCGLNTGLVIAGGIGTRTHQTYSVMGDAVNLAARLEDASARGEILVGPETYRLTQAQFTYERLTPIAVKGKAEPVQVYRVLGRAEERQQGGGGAGAAGLLPLVGREAEVTWLLNRWEQVKAGRGQVVLLSGEAGIGKSRLVQALKEHLAGDVHLCIECYGSPYYQQSAFYPLVEQMQRRLQWSTDDTPEEKLRKLEAALQPHHRALEEVVPLFAALLALPLPERYPPLALTPQRQKQQTLAAMLAWLLQDTERQPVCFVMEDVHWVDASTLEFLSLLIDQVPTTRILVLLLCRPDFRPPWAGRSHLTHLALTCLTSRQVTAMITQLTGRKALPAEVHRHLVATTDGVPLFVEESIKMVLESGLLQEQEGGYALVGPLPSRAIPTTLYDTLMARLDRLGPAKQVAQLGAVVGREFSYALLQAVSLADDVTLHQVLGRLVEAEFHYQRGLPPHATYLFKHALIQEAAYQSLLKSTRQQYHRRIAQVLESTFPEITERQPAVLAHHYTEAGSPGAAVQYWLRAGQAALGSWALVEAINYLERGLQVLLTEPESLERDINELTLRVTLGTPLMLTRGYAAPEVEATYGRAFALCGKAGAMATTQLFPALWGLWIFYHVKAEYAKAEAMGEQLLQLAEQSQDTGLLLGAHQALGATRFLRGCHTQGRQHLEEALRIYDMPTHAPLALLFGQDGGVFCLALLIWVLWQQGETTLAHQRRTEALALSQVLQQPSSHSFVELFVAVFHCHMGEFDEAESHAKIVSHLAEEQSMPHWGAMAAIARGWALQTRGRADEGAALIRSGIDALLGIGSRCALTYWRGALIEAELKRGEFDEALELLNETLAFVEDSDERYYEAELHRLHGMIVLAQGGSTAKEAAGVCFKRAIEVATAQGAETFVHRARTNLQQLG